MAILRSVVAWLLVCTVPLGGLGCSSTRTIQPSADPANPAFGAVKSGDRVTLHLNDGRRVQIRVQAVDADALVSVEGNRYARNDIARIERRSLSVMKTTALVAAIVLGAFVVAGILIVSAVDDILSGRQ